MYLTINYIETSLRSFFEGVLNRTDFWGYEKSLAERRSRFETWNDALVATLGFLAILGACISIRRFTLLDYGALFVSVILVIGIIAKTEFMLRTKRRFASGIKGDVRR
jgi:hypothetical protein